MVADKLMMEAVNVWKRESIVRDDISFIIIFLSNNKNTN